MVAPEVGAWPPTPAGIQASPPVPDGRRPAGETRGRPRSSSATSLTSGIGPRDAFTDEISGGTPPRARHVRASVRPCERRALVAIWRTGVRLGRASSGTAIATSLAREGSRVGLAGSLERPFRGARRRHGRTAAITRWRATDDAAATYPWVHGCLQPRRPASSGVPPERASPRACGAGGRWGCRAAGPAPSPARGGSDSCRVAAGRRGGRQPAPARRPPFTANRQPWPALRNPPGRV
jgi:hypothetical protein